MMVDALEENVMKDILSMGLEQKKEPVTDLLYMNCFVVLLQPNTPRHQNAPNSHNPQMWKCVFTGGNDI